MGKTQNNPSYTEVYEALMINMGRRYHHKLMFEYLNKAVKCVSVFSIWHGLMVWCLSRQTYRGAFLLLPSN